MSEAPAPIIPVLPSLTYACDRCGLRVSHDDDARLVREVALLHTKVAHRRNLDGEVAIRWHGFLDDTTITQLTNDLCGHRWDMWVDEFEATFEFWGGGDTDRPLDDALAIVGRLVGPDLEIVDLRR